MYFIQYYDTKLNGELDEALGDRSVVQLDGRNNLNTMKDDAVEFNGFRRPVYKAYQIRKGKFTNYRTLTGVTAL